MSVESSIYLDTNAIIALVEGSETTGGSLQAFIEKPAAVGKVTFHISSLCFAELLVVPYRQKNNLLAEEYLNLGMRFDQLRIHPVNRVILDAAAVLRANIGRLKLPDAIHLATASIARCRYFFTFDKDFADLPPRPHPVFERADLAAVKVVRPDPISLSELAETLK